jgi:hypothetical protein
VAQSAEEALQVHRDCAHTIQLVLTDLILLGATASLRAKRRASSKPLQCRCDARAV